MAERKIIDWPAVEHDYRTGVKSLRLMGREYGVSESGIARRAKRDGWLRGVGGKDVSVAEVTKVAKASEVDEANTVVADTKVELDTKTEAKAGVTLPAHQKNQQQNQLQIQYQTQHQTQDRNQERAQQQAQNQAQVQTEIILSHRRNIARVRNVTMRMIEELEVQTDNPDLLDELRESLSVPDNKAQEKRDDLFRRAISLSSRTSTMKTLADSLKILIMLEREAFGVDNKKAEAGSGIEDVIRKVRGRDDD